MVLFIWSKICQSVTVLWCTFVSQHQSFPQSRNSFKVGMKLEGLDPSHPSLFCVLTVAEVRLLMAVFGIYIFIPVHNEEFSHTCASFPFASQIQGYRIRLHFDGYPECYDFWANADSWDIKPAGWCEKNGHKLLLPKGNETQTHTNWHLWMVFQTTFLSEFVLQVVRMESLTGACMWRTAGVSWLQNIFSRASTQWVLNTSDSLKVFI